MKTLLNTLLLILILTSKLCSQNYYLNLNPLQSLVSVNPSFAGNNGGLRVQSQLSYKDFEWANNTINHLYSFNCVDVYLKELKAGISLSCLTRNRFYSNKNVDANKSINISYAHYLNFYKGKLKIIPSLQFGYNNNSKTYNFGQLPKSKKVDYFAAIGGGLLFEIKNFYFGISQERYPKEFKDSYDPNTSVYIAGDINFNAKTKLNISYLYKGNYYGDYNQQINGNMILYKHFLTGIGVQIYGKVHPIFTVGYRQKSFSIQCLYSYNNNISYMKSKGIFQLASSFYLGYKTKKDTLRNIENW